ncbi:SARP family pathway specific regulatory protein [Streptomyces venezuelae]|uniref:BTAD domain-containing putative transcriptional regulator n=1 Tax=Streptomyces gardneri TaxID=66892 RepID=UPI0006BE0063|nr:BTAD domain-containing putative transcriptional regulator [Streptomyces gardneri]ALO12799.1 SARP family pathway specific regulatory protein [Streptomyces venezuelae]QPK49513.1 AAA family ATPase [Streptomyces gardneri]WRK41053.1 BTAD domain-containing putative transcriptional regulator [Streptomyces venezuelae]CUM36547.1 Cys-tRNA(Pro) deacylase YbaK [Streptomyces venezuelae]
MGFLLLKANKVVATSQLLNAVWSADDAPSSARKILQNAVWGLRGILHNGAQGGSGNRTTQAPVLLTQAPGYMLRVEPEQVDLFRFERRATQGRAELEAGRTESAARLLKEALDLWRGPALTDLVETGISWPELSAVQGARTDAMEDFFEAQLALGRHHSVLGELETLVEREPLRERACSQLMLALYRCGRQADALNVYGRIRSALVENLGLEPGHELRTLQQAILTHDPVLTLQGAATSYEFSQAGATTEHAVALRGVAGAPAYRAGSAASPTPADGAAAGPAEAAPVGAHQTVVSEHRKVGVVLLRTELHAHASETGIEADRLLQGTAAAVEEEIERHGGTIAGSVGPFSLALFGVHRGRADDAERAVRAALAIRDRLAPTQQLAVKAAVEVGEALVRYLPGDEETPPSAVGALMDECHRLLALVPQGEIRVSDSTFRETESVIAYEPAEDPSSGWRVRSGSEEPADHHGVPIVDREIELEVLRGLLELARHRGNPHLVTLLGQGGVGKTRFIVELEHRITGRPHAPLFLATRATLLYGNHPLSAQIAILASCCGIQQGDSGKSARAKLASTLHQLVQCEETAGRLLPYLSPLVDPEGSEIRQPMVSELLNAWYEFVGLAAEERPLVIVVDDLHRGDDRLLDCVEQLPDRVGAVPLVVIAAARPELLERRPDWGSGSRQATTLTLEPLSDAAEQRLQELLSAATPGDAQETTGGTVGAITAGGGRSPGGRPARAVLRLAEHRHSGGHGAGLQEPVERIQGERQYG